MKNLFSLIISLNTLLKHSDWALLIYGLCIFSYETMLGEILNSIIMTVIILLIAVLLGKLIVGIMNLIVLISLWITKSITNHFLKRHNDNDLTMFKFIIIALFMICYGIICTWVFLSQKHEIQNFYYNLLFLYIAIMYPAMMIVNKLEDNAFDLFGAVWTFFYRISFVVGLIILALFNGNLLAISIVAIVGMSVPINISYLYLKTKIENSICKIMDFYKKYNFANLGNNTIAMPACENGQQIVILITKKGNEYLVSNFKDLYQETFGHSIQQFEMSSWNNKCEFYTMFKFKE